MTTYEETLDLREAIYTWYLCKGLREVHVYWPERRLVVVHDDDYDMDDCGDNAAEWVADCRSAIRCPRDVVVVREKLVRP